MIWTLLTVFASIIGVALFLYFLVQHMKLLNMSELAIVFKYSNNKDERWIPASQIEDLEENIEEDTALGVPIMHACMPIDLLEEGD